MKTQFDLFEQFWVESRSFPMEADESVTVMNGWSFLINHFIILWVTGFWRNWENTDLKKFVYTSHRWIGCLTPEKVCNSTDSENATGSDCSMTTIVNMRDSRGEGKASDWLCIMTEIGIQLCRLFLLFFCFFFSFLLHFQSIFRSQKTIEHLISPATPSNTLKFGNWAGKQKEKKNTYLASYQKYAGTGARNKNKIF